jgi:hypothetical protein
MCGVAVKTSTLGNKLTGHSNTTAVYPVTVKATDDLKMKVATSFETSETEPISARYETAKQVLQPGILILNTLTCISLFPQYVEVTCDLSAATVRP